MYIPDARRFILCRHRQKNSVITLAKPFRHKTLEERAAEFDGKLMTDGYDANFISYAKFAIFSHKEEGDRIGTDVAARTVIV